MRFSTRLALTGALLGTLVATVATDTGSAAPPPGDAAHAPRLDNRAGPLTRRQNERRKAAIQKLLSGEAAADDGVVQLADDKFFEVAQTGTAQIFTVLAEFGSSARGKYGTVPGPIHNQIPEPDRATDNTTIWAPDFDTAHYDDMFFGDAPSFAEFYEEQSSGAFSADGYVSDWVTVPGNASLYGDNAIEDFGGSWKFVADTVNAWYAAQKAAGRSDADINAQLAGFDVWDRYDWDSDGDFDEPDGYLDHFQAVHAGQGEEVGGGAQGEDAIWSHRWYVNPTDYGVTGPTVGGQQVKFGGARIGTSNFWVGDYTTEPENGGLGVFTHEFGHDLGLPDLYDTNGGDNSTGFWTLMSAGSYLNDGTVDIGSRPGFMGPWEKLQLGWLDYAVVSPGESGAFTLSPSAEQVAGQEQGVIVDIPDQALETTYNTPASGAAEWWTGSADDLNVSLSRSVDLTGISKATLSTQAWYDIEEGYDFLFAEYRAVGTADWLPAGAPITGSSNGRWKTLKWTIPGGGPTEVRFRYQTDGGVHNPGAFLDDITVKVGGTTLFSDDVEAGANGWTTDGWSIVSGTVEKVGDRYYLLENRTYVSYDGHLATGPYLFSKQVTAPDWAERFPYQDGLLVWAVDGTYDDNNTIDHPGHGQALPVDARPEPIEFSDGTILGNRRQPFDATFGVQATDPVTFHKEVVVGTGKKVTVQTLAAAVPANPGIATFTDADPDAYYSEDNPLGSALVAGHGVTVTVTGQTTGGPLTINVTNPAE